MSVYYTVKEKLTVRNREACEEMIYSMKCQLSLLGVLMLQDDAAIEKISLKADGKEYTFSGKEITPELHALLRAMDDAEALELEAIYDYTWRLCYEDMNIGPFAVCETAEMLLKNDPSAANDFYYYMYNEADCASDDIGKSVEYGKKI